jgi:diguanylate cyclase (GGDEF)-like protein
VHPFRERRLLRRSKGDEALVYLSASVLRDPDGTQYHVTTAEDISDKHLLEDQLRFQSTHDSLTGLANRQHFIGRLEEALGGKRAVKEITVFHIDLDGFSAVNDGPGRPVGDRLLQIVAGRLKDVVADETATVARLDADEFGILIENSPTTPSAATIAARINDELSEPVYVSGHGVAATASIAVLQRPSPNADPLDLLQATDITLRRLKASGRRQWGFVDQAQDARDRERFNLAASIPGAFESGQIDLEYQPLFAIEDRRIVAVQALLRWNHTELGCLDHNRCVAVLEETGLSLPIGRWMLSRACEQVQSWRDRLADRTPRLYVELTRQQASDQDLISTVSTALNETGLPSESLILGMPVQALCMVDGLAEDNLDVLVDLGITAVLHEFGTTGGDLACLEDLPVQAVKMARRVVTRVMRGADKESLFARATRDLVPLVRGTGASVFVSGIETEEQLEWWRGVGADTAQGRLLGPPGIAEDLEDLIAG